MSDFRMRSDKPANKLNRPVICMGGILPVDRSTPPVRQPEPTPERKDIVISTVRVEEVVKSEPVVEPEPQLVTKLAPPKRGRPVKQES